MSYSPSHLLMSGTIRQVSPASPPPAATATVKRTADFLSRRQLFDNGLVEDRRNSADPASSFGLKQTFSSSATGTPVAPLATISPSTSASSSASDRRQNQAQQKQQHRPGSSNNDSTFFYGRSHELDRLRRIRQHVIVEHSQSAHDAPPVYPVALVWGNSGTGKSALIRRFLDKDCCTCESQPIPASSHTPDRNTDSQRPNERCHPNGGAVPPDAESHPSQQRCACCYVLQGKYDECHGVDDPFSAIFQALDDFATQLRNGPNHELERIRHAIRHAFHCHSDSSVLDRDSQNSHTSSTHHGIGTDRQHASSAALAFLVSVVPSLSILQYSAIQSTPEEERDGAFAVSPAPAALNVPCQGTSTFSASPPGSAAANVHSSCSNGSSGSTYANWNKLVYVFVKFVKAISTAVKPVYLFLDDLQWSSSAGLELLAALVSDPDLRHFMFLASVRQETDYFPCQRRDFVGSDHGDDNLRGPDKDVTGLPPDVPLRAAFLSPLQSGQSTATASSNGQSGSSGSRVNRRLEQIVLRDLSLIDTTRWLAHMLAREEDDDDLRALTEKIYEKTSGNTHYTLQAIEELMLKNVLVFSRITFRWEWNPDGSSRNKDRRSTLSTIDGIYTASMPSPRLGIGPDPPEPDAGSFDLLISDNVVNAIESQLKELPNELQQVLAVAAYIRSTFDVRVLLHVLQHSRESHIDDPWGITVLWNSDSLTQVLGEAESKRLFVRTEGSGRYRFVHDQIRQAAHDLIPYGEVRDKLKLKIGHCLLEMYHNSHAPSRGTPADVATTESVFTDDGLLFVAADHLNSVPSKNHLFILMVNLEVGEKALDMVALSSAAAYLQRAANALKLVRRPWEVHYGVCIRLLRVRSDVELSLGRFETGYRLGNEVLDRAKELDDKLPTFLSMARALGRQNRFAESLQMSLRAARTLKAFPRRSVQLHIARDMLTIKKYLKTHSDDDIVGLPAMTDARKEMAMRFIAEIGMRAYATRDTVLWIVHFCKIVKATIRDGISEESAMGFACLGTFWNSVADSYSLALRCADLAHKLLDRTDTKLYGGWTYRLTSNFVYAFAVSPERLIENYRAGCALGMEAGEFEMGLANLVMRTTVACVFGRPLEDVLLYAETAERQQVIYRVDAFAGVVLAQLSYVRMLTGSETIDWVKIDRMSERRLKFDLPHLSDGYGLTMLYLVHSALAVYFRRYACAYRLARLCSLVSTADDGSFAMVTFRAYVTGLSACGLYRETGGRGLLRELRRQIRILESVVERKGSNALCYVQLLRAEALSLRYDGASRRRLRCDGVEKVLEAYDAAIWTARMSSVTNLVAQTCELAGEFLVRVRVRRKVYGDGGQCGTTGRGSDGLERAVSLDAIDRYMFRALEYYEEWGCSIKAEDVLERRSEYCCPEQESL